jgi:photosystem II stability/assembly factor-like uncharacterized protein
MKSLRMCCICLIGFLVLSGFLPALQVQSHHQTESISSGDAFVFKSTDGGTSWSAVINFDTGLSAHAAHVIVVDPSTSSTVYIGTNNGLIKTTDGGSTWGEVTVGLNDRDIRAIAVYPQHPAILYILAYSQIGGGGSVYKSTDAGKNWQQVTPTSPAYSLTFDPHNPSILYAGGSDPDVPLVHKTTDGGGSWSYVRLAGLGLTAIDQLALDSTAPASLYASNRGGLNRGGVSKSTDAGRTWRRTSLDEITILSLIHDPRTASILYVAGPDGILKSEDGGDQWIDLSKGLNKSIIQCLTTDPTNSARLFAGAFNGLFMSTDGGLTWAVANLDRNIVSVAIDPGNPSTVYAGSVAELPRITSVSVEGKRLIVEGVAFHDGAAIYLDGERQKTQNDAESPHTILIGKKAGKKIVIGQSVSLQVLDADGVWSGRFIFTRLKN